mmetsp:Transcript_28094/g.62534  ORF Transcript_28094/g.62534 Transcript_28094/m.62534 type:complete len:202 (-) Transcript_28094:1345-1950(-)
MPPLTPWLPWTLTIWRSPNRLFPSPRHPRLRLPRLLLMRLRVGRIFPRAPLASPQLEFPTRLRSSPPESAPAMMDAVCSARATATTMPNAAAATSATSELPTSPSRSATGLRSSIATTAPCRWMAPPPAAVPIPAGAAPLNWLLLPLLLALALCLSRKHLPLVCVGIVPVALLMIDECASFMTGLLVIYSCRERNVGMYPR